MKASKAVKKHLESLIGAISEAVMPFGPGIVSIWVKEINIDTISLTVFEMPTELLYGPMDGSEIFYGFSFNMAPITEIINIQSSLFVNDEEGISMLIKGDTVAAPNRNIILQVNGDPPENVKPAQEYNIKNSNFIARKLPANVIAIIKGRP
jgi:hypothetical protein